MPVIAAVHGHALGGGLQLALGADIRIAHPDTKLSVRELHWGITPDMTGTFMLTRLVRNDVARELTYTARVFDARKATRSDSSRGSASSRYDDAMALARRDRGAQPERRARRQALFNRMFTDGAAEQFADERRVIRSLIGTPNQVEAITANLEGRPPVVRRRSRRLTWTQELRVIRLVVPGRSPRSILVDGDGNVPSIRLTIEPGDTTVGAVARTVLPSLGFDSHVVDFYIDQSRSYSATDVVPAYVELAEPDPSWTSPDGWHEVDVSQPTLVIEPELAPRLTEWIDERLGRDVPDPLRAPWTRPGWYERACAWIDRALDDAHLGAATAIVQHRHWGISAVMRVETERERYWFKAVFDHFRREPSVTAFIADLAPGATAGVVASEASEGWMLLADLPGDAAPDEHGHRTAFEHLARLQAITRNREHDLLSAGCAAPPADRDPWRPRQRARRSDVRRVAPGRRRPCRAARRVALRRRAAGRAARAPRRARARRLPPRQRPARRRSARRRCMVIFDWSDAAIAKPFVDVMTWATWLPHDAERPRRAVAVVRRGVGGCAPAGDVAGAATDAGGDRRRLPRRQLRRHRAQPRSAPPPRARRRHDRVLQVPRRRRHRQTQACQTQVCESASPRVQLSHA